MKVCGIVVEYNPFHNGHVYHINKVRELIKPDVLIAIMSPTFMQRGEPAIINKMERTKFALKYDVDLVVELPSVYALQSANYFAKGALEILNELKITHLVFGSESNDVNKLIDAAKISNTQDYQDLVKEYVKKGQRYANACNLAFNDYRIDNISLSNDILALAYVQEIIKNNYQIKPISILRTNEYLTSETTGYITSATAIRNLLKNKQDIDEYTPMNHVLVDNYNNLCFLDNLWSTLQYLLTVKMPTEIREIAGFDEGLEYLFLKNIEKASSIDNFIALCSSKRYPATRIQRAICYLICNIKKENLLNIELDYIRILGFNDLGQQYLKDIKNKTEFKILTTISNHQSNVLELEVKLSKLYAFLCDNPKIKLIDFSKIIKL